MQYTHPMKSATLPAVRVDPQLREQVERLLRDNETLSEFVEASVRESVNRRLAQTEFVARGLASLERALKTGDFVPAETAIQGLKDKLAKAKQVAAKRKKG